MQEPSDRALVLEVRRGEDQAFGELVRRYQNSVFGVCYRLLGQREEAEDLSQEAFLRAYQRLHTYDVERPFGPWMRRVAANLCLNQLKRKRLIQFPLEDEFELPAKSTWGDPVKSQEQSELATKLRDAIMELPTHYRAVVELRHFEEMSYAEIAEVLDLPLSDIKSHLYRARKRLAQLVSDEG